MGTKRKTLLLTATVSLCFQVCEGAAAPMVHHEQTTLSNPQQLAQSFASYFSRRVREDSITGAAFVVATPHGIVHIGTEGYTDAGRSRPIDEHTAFRVASISKTFAAGLAAMLVREGAFGWRDSVVDHVPDFQINGDTERIRIEHLLGQSTGLMPHAFDNLIEDGLSIDRIRAQYRKLSYLCPPGECYSYQNSIFSLIEPVIERATSRSYESMMRERIFLPLDMKTATVGYRPLVENPNHAKPHVKSRGQWKTVRVKPNYYQVAPAAGVNASILDMGKWLTAQMGGRPAVLDPGLIATLVEPRVTTRQDKRRRYWSAMLSDAHYGLGWRVYRLGEEEIAYHSGWVSGYRADIAWSEEHRIGIAVLMNAEAECINELTTTFWKMTFESPVPLAHDAGPDGAGQRAASP
jgi:beta-lactamase class C